MIYARMMETSRFAYPPRLKRRERITFSGATTLVEGDKVSIAGRGRFKVVSIIRNTAEIEEE